LDLLLKAVKATKQLQKKQQLRHLVEQYLARAEQAKIASEASSGTALYELLL